MIKGRVFTSPPNGSNIRKIPSMNGAIIGAIKLGDEFEWLDEDNGWVHIRTASREGYVAVSPYGGSVFTYGFVPSDVLNQNLHEIPVGFASYFTLPPELIASPELRGSVASVLRGLADWIDNHAD